MVIAKRSALPIPWLGAGALFFVAGCATRPPPPPPGPPRPAAPASSQAPRPSVRLGLETSIEVICASPAGKAVLDRDLPGLTTRPEFAMFKAMSLKQLQPLSRGGITNAAMAKVQRDLASVNASAAGK